MKPLRIYLFDEIDKSLLEKVTVIVSSIMTSEITIMGKIDCESGFSPGRKQWRADKMVNECLTRYSSNSYFTIGLTERDIYVQPLNFVFGLAIRESNCAIVSWYRLSGVNMVVRLAKEIIHEVGHLQGLEHCQDKRCVMSFSNTIDEVDIKGPDFCDMCKSRL